MSDRYRTQPVWCCVVDKMHVYAKHFHRNPIFSKGYKTKRRNVYFHTHEPKYSTWHAIAISIAQWLRLEARGFHFHFTPFWIGLSLEKTDDQLYL